MKQCDNEEWKILARPHKLGKGSVNVPIGEHILEVENPSTRLKITAIKAKTTNKIGWLIENPYFCNVEQKTQKYGNDKRTSAAVAERGQAE